MKLKGFGKVWALFLSAVTVTGCLSGCGGADKTPQNRLEQQKGCYVQNSQELQEQFGDWTVKQIFKVDEKVHLLLAKETEGNTVLREWRQEGETFEDVTQEWLAGLTLSCEAWADMKLMQGENVQYLYAQLVEEDCYRRYLWRSDGAQAKEITPQKWTVKNEEWGFYEMIDGIAALDNGSLAVKSTFSLDIVYGEDGSVLSSEELTGYYGEDVLTDGINVYLLGLDGGGTIKEIEKRTEGRVTDTIPFGQGSSMGVCLDVLKDGTLISAGADGIFRCRVGEKSWEKLLSGSETDFSLSSCWCTGIAAMEDGTIFALFQAEGGKAKLVKYEYDPDAVRQVTETLRLYAVKESFILQNAAALYHMEHPEVMIELEYAYSYDDQYSGKKLDYNEVYQELNTMLMGENAPDILVMDNLDIESFEEKGLLAEIDDVLKPMEEQGLLLGNIMGAYVRADGNRYVAPLQFSIPIGVGRDIAAGNMQSLEKLAGFLETAKDNYMGEQTVSELVDKFYPFFCREIVQDKVLNRDVLAQKLGCLKQIADNCGIVKKHDSSHNDGRCYNIWNLASDAKFAFDEADGFKGSMFAVAICDYIKGEFSAFENSFTPLVQMGICTKTKYMSTAKDFLSFALSEAVQDTDYYEGFSVNSVSLEKQMLSDRSDVAACTTIMTADGGEEMFNIGDYSKETAEKLYTLCRTVDNPICKDEKIREVLTDSIGEYLDGSRSLEDTVQKMESGLKMYLAE